ncbi:hypothetical protein SGLAM104S_01054 [Streptomyces glaucescens]
MPWPAVPRIPRLPASPLPGRPGPLTGGDAPGCATARSSPCSPSPGSSTILALVREETGTEGFLVGLGLAVLPVPLLIAAFRWLDRVEPGPWRNLLFAFAWGACAAALINALTNSFATRWIATATADPASADTLGATVIAPVVEESAKAAAILLLFLFRRRDFTGIVDGVVIAGVTATGFAFTENILYLGTAFGTDQMHGDSGIASVTAATFFVRVVMSPFAHPLFTVLTGIGFGIAALSGDRRRLRRVLLPLSGLLLAMGMHAFWNGSATFGEYGFFAVYGAFMVPAFGILTWLVIWTRQRELRTVREELPPYVAAGWLGPAEPFALGSMRARTAGPRVRRAPSRQSGLPRGRRVRGVRDVAGVPPAPGTARPGGHGLPRPGTGAAARAVAPPGGGPPGPGVRRPGDGACGAGDDAVAGPWPGGAVPRAPVAVSRAPDAVSRAAVAVRRAPGAVPGLQPVPDLTPPGRARARPAWRQAEASPSRASSSSVSRSSATPSSAGSWSGVRAEAIGAATVGCAASQARATVATGTPCAAATASSASSTRRPRSLSRCLPARPPGRCPRPAPGRYLPVRKPEASAK